MRLGEVWNPGPADHDRDSAQDEPCPRRTHINEAGDAAPGSHDSVTQGIRNLQLADIPAAQPDHADRPSETQQQPRHLRAFLRCAERGAGPHAIFGGSDNGLMVHMGQKRGGQSLIQESVAQLRQLGRAACVICIAARKPLQPLQCGHRNSGHTRGRYFPISATARPSGCRCKTVLPSPTIINPHSPLLPPLP